MSALRTMQIATPLSSGLASFFSVWRDGHGTHWSSSTLQLQADRRVGIRWAGHGFLLLMGTAAADILLRRAWNLGFFLVRTAAGGSVPAQNHAQNHQRFALLTDLTCLVLADLLICSTEIACLATIVHVNFGLFWCDSVAAEGSP